MKRDFDEIITNLRETIATYDSYVDFPKVYQRVSEVEMKLNLLNYLIGKEDIEKAFFELIAEYPDVIEGIPILLAVREGEIQVIDDEIISYSFKTRNREINDYMKLLRESGLVELLQTKRVKNLVDYVTGVEVGLDSHTRKNRTGKLMEGIVECYLQQVSNVNYLSQATVSQIEEHFNTNVFGEGILDDDNKLKNKRFDFALRNNEGKLFLIETNFYSSRGSKLNETARSYCKIAQDIKNFQDVEFVWITDGQGWLSTKNDLREAHTQIEHLYTLEDLDNGVLEKL